MKNRKQKKEKTIKINLIKLIFIAIIISLSVSYVKSGKIKTLFGSKEKTISPETETIYISNSTQLKNFRDEVNNNSSHKGSTVIITENIELDENESWTPIENFNGTIDGKGHAIKNVSINADQVNNQAFISNPSNSETINIKNLGLENVNIQGQNNVSGLISIVNGTVNIENCYVNGEISGNNNVSGIVSTDLSNGGSTINISKSFNGAQLTSQGNYVGGIANYGSGGSIQYCYNYGDIIDNVGNGRYYGGIIGKTDSTSIKYCYNVAKIGADSNGNITESTNKKAIAGEYSNSQNGYNYYLKITGLTDKYAQAKEDSYMKNQESANIITLLGGDNIWCFDKTENATYLYPILKWQDAEARIYSDYAYLNGRKVLLGDVDENSQIESNDAVLIDKYVRGEDIDLDRLAADVTGDRKVTDNDAASITSYLESPYIFDSKYNDRITIYTGQTIKLNPQLIIGSKDSTIQNTLWSSVNSQIASVDQGGNVTGNKEGNTTIIVDVSDNNVTRTAKINITVENSTHIYTDTENYESEGVSILVGDVNYDGTINAEDLENLQTEINEGNATYSIAKDTDGNKIIDYKDADLLKSKINGKLDIFPALWKDKIEIYVGDEVTLKVASLYAKANNYNINITNWESTNTDYVTVNNGTIKGIKPGNATVKVKATINGIESETSILVDVKKATELQDLTIEETPQESNGETFYNYEHVNVVAKISQGTKGIKNIKYTINEMSLGYDGGSVILYDTDEEETTYDVQKGTNDNLLKTYTYKDITNGDTIENYEELKFEATNVYGIVKYTITVEETDGNKIEKDITYKNINPENTEEYTNLESPEINMIPMPSDQTINNVTYLNRLPDFVYSVATDHEYDLKCYKDGNEVNVLEIQENEPLPIFNVKRGTEDGLYKICLTVYGEDPEVYKTAEKTIFIDRVAPAKATIEIEGQYHEIEVDGEVEKYYITQPTITLKRGEDNEGGSGTQITYILENLKNINSGSNPTSSIARDERYDVTYTDYFTEESINYTDYQAKTISVFSRDYAGNVGENSIDNFTLDLVKPEVYEASINDNNKIEIKVSPDTKEYMITSSNIAPDWQSTNWIARTSDWTTEYSHPGFVGQYIGTIDNTLGNGTYYVWTKDIAGNVSEGYKLSINSDNSIGVKLVKSDRLTSNENGEYEEGTWTKDEIKVILSSTENSEITKYQYKIGTSGTWNQVNKNSQNIGTVILDTEGDNTVIFRGVIDEDNNEYTDEIERQIKTDYHSPIITVDTIESNIGQYSHYKATEENPLTITLEDTISGLINEGKITYEFYSYDTSTEVETYEVENGSSFYQDGEYTFYAKDQAGNEQSIDLIIDNKKPVMVIEDDDGLELPGGEWYNKTITVSALDLEEDEKITVKYNDGEEEQYGISNPIKFSEDGKYEAYAIDYAGNESDHIIFYIDKTKPIITLSGTKQGDIYKGNVTATASDEGGSTLEENPLIMLDGGRYPNGHEFTEEKTYTIKTKDKAGNESDTITFTIDNSEPSSNESFEVISPYQIEGTYITRVSPNTKLSEFKTKIEVENVTYKVTNSSNTELGQTDIVKTGDKVKVTKSTGTTEYIIVVVGDVNKDGLADLVDMSMIQKYILKVKQTTFDGAQTKAADIYLDNVIDIVDISNLQKYIIGLKKSLV